MPSSASRAAPLTPPTGENSPGHARSQCERNATALLFPRVSLHTACLACHWPVQPALSHMESRRATVRLCPSPTRLPYARPHDHRLLPTSSGANSPSLQETPPQQKAWTHGANPLTHPSSSTPVSSNGALPVPRPHQTPTSAVSSAESPTPMRHLNDRMMYLLANLIVSRGCLNTARLTHADVLAGPAWYHYPEERRHVLRRSLGSFTGP